MAPSDSLEVFDLFGPLQQQYTKPALHISPPPPQLLLDPALAADCEHAVRQQLDAHPGITHVSHPHLQHVGLDSLSIAVWPVVEKQLHAYQQSRTVAATTQQLMDAVTNQQLERDVQHVRQLLRDVDSSLVNEVLQQSNSCNELMRRYVHQQSTHDDDTATVFGSSSALTAAELDGEHYTVISHRQLQLSPADIQQLRPADGTLHFLDLSGSQYSGVSEYVMHKRRKHGLRSSGWSYDWPSPSQQDEPRSSFINAVAAEEGQQAYQHTANATMMDALQFDTLGKLFTQLQAATRGQGVQLLMSESSRLLAADAAPSDEDAAAKSLLLQVMTTFHVLAANGSTMLRVAHLQSPLIISLLYVLYHTFQTVVVHQPLIDDSQTAEQLTDCWLVCRRFAVQKPLQRHIRDHLASLHRHVNTPGDLQKLAGVSQICVVDSSTIVTDDLFVQWLSRAVGKQQAHELHRLAVTAVLASRQPASGLEPITTSIDCPDVVMTADELLRRYSL